MDLKFAPQEIDRLVARQQMVDREWYPTIVAIASTPGGHSRLLMVKTAKAKPGEVPSWMPPQRAIKLNESCANAAHRVLLEEVGIESPTLVDYRGHCNRVFGPGRWLDEEGWEHAKGRLMVYVHLRLPEGLDQVYPRDPSISDCTLADAGKYVELLRTSSLGKRRMTHMATDRSHVFNVMPALELA